jgi:nicotinamide mononucleotide transporter
VVLAWFFANWVEITGSVLGLISVWYQYQQKPWLWPVSIVVAILYTYVFIQSGLYAYTLLQLYYLVVSVYGWYLWVKRKNEGDTLAVTFTRLREMLILGMISVLIFVILYYVLLNFTDSTVPLIDAGITSLSFIATWMLARKKLENWLVWFVVDVASVGLYIHKELYATAVFYSVLVVVAIAGYFQWKKSVRI